MEQNQPVIEIIMLGHRKRAGKDTLAGLIVKNELQARGLNKESFTFEDSLKEGMDLYRFAFADSLKRSCKDLFNLSDEQVFGDELKEVIDERYGKTPREILQWFGTQMRTIDPDIWCRKVAEEIENSYEMWGTNKIIITDFRFPNEGEYILKFKERMEAEKGWKVIVKFVRIDNPNLPPLDMNDHVSETALHNWPKWNMVIENSGTKEDLLMKWNMINGSYDLALLMKEVAKAKGKELSVGANGNFEIDGMDVSTLQKLADALDAEIVNENENQNN